MTGPRRTTCAPIGAPAPLVTWELYYQRNNDDGAPNDYSTTVAGPPPIADVNDAATIPADVRAFAQFIGRANSAHWVTYTTHTPADCTGYAETGAVASVSHGTPWHGEKVTR
jgi:hypothetical protein